MILSGVLERIYETTVHFFALTEGGLAHAMSLKATNPKVILETQTTHYHEGGSSPGRVHFCGEDVWEEETSQYFDDPIVFDSIDMIVMLYDFDENLCDCVVEQQLSDDDIRGDCGDALQTFAEAEECNY